MEKKRYEPLTIKIVELNGGGYDILTASGDKAQDDIFTWDDQLKGGDVI